MTLFLWRYLNNDENHYLNLFFDEVKNSMI
jgi:hypothetical protein